MLARSVLSSTLGKVLDRPLYKTRAITAAGSGGGGFNPASIYADGTTGWVYDPATAPLFQSSAGITDASATTNPVGYMGDTSGNGWNITQSTDAKRPLLIIDGDRKAIRFNGSSAAMSCAAVDLSGATKGVMVVALRQNIASASAGVILEQGSGVSLSTGGIACYVNNGVSGAAGGGLGIGAGGYMFANGPAAIAPRTYVITLIYDPSGADGDARCAIRINGEPVNETQPAIVGSLTSAVFAVRDLFMGGRSGTSLYANFDLYFSAMAGRELTQAEMEGMESLAAQRAGIPALAFTATPTQFTDTGAAVDMGDYILTSNFASADYTTSATEIDVSCFNTIFNNFAVNTEIGVYSNNVYVGRVAPTGLGAHTERVYLAAGAKTISLVNGLETRTGTGQPVLGTFVTTVAANASLTQANLTPSNRVLFYGDSITAGSAATIAVKDSYAMQVRTAYRPNSVALEAWGFRALHDDASDATKRAAFVAKLVAYAPARIWLSIGTNDYGLNKWTAGDFGTAYAALLDDINAALPGVPVFCQTPIVRSAEAANGSGSTCGDYRTAIGTAVSTRTGFATLVDGTTFMTTASLADGIHPTTAGHTLFANAVKTALGIA